MSNAWSEILKQWQSEYGSKNTVKIEEPKEQEYCPYCGEEVYEEEESCPLCRRNYEHMKYHAPNN